jgi:uncharacterized protein (DUF1330 family)
MSGTASIFPTQSQLEELRSLPAEEPVVMLNLLRFKAQADGVDEGISGREAYARYAAATGHFLEKVGGRVLNAVDARDVVIGPAEPEWEMALLVEYPTPARFLEMAGDPDYLKAHAHREAALADSRLIACRKLGPELF